MTLEEFFEGHEASRPVFEALAAAIAAIGPSEIRVSRSQVAFARQTVFARAWMPRAYLGRGTPLVLTLGFRHRDPSPRWKEVVEPAPGRFTHHLELGRADDVDDEVRAWLQEAWLHAA